jgi:pimeloyl-ACP methyl ester carboxylesterase
VPTVRPDPETTIAYSVEGEGRPVVLVHGITESRRAWDPLVGMLTATGHRVIAVDLRGHGESSHRPPYDLTTMAADVATVVDAEGAADPLLIGHSLGGAVVSACAAAHPCRGVVNVDQPLALAGFQDALRSVEPQLRGDTATFRSAVSAIFDEMAGALGGDERARIERIRDPDQDVVLGVWDVALTASPAELDEVVGQVAATITVPYLSLHGIDPGPDYAAWLTERVPTATVEVWPDTGHYPHLVDPERFVARVVELDG